EHHRRGRTAVGVGAATKRTAILAARVECAKAAKVRQHPVAILGGERLIELRLRQRFAQQLRDVAVEVRPCLSQANPPSCERAARLIQIGALAVRNEDLRWHLQLAAVAQRQLVVIRDPHRSSVEVQAVVEGARLARAVLLAGRAAAHGEHAAAGARASSTRQSYPALPSSCAVVMPASPPPRMTTRTPDTRPLRTT